MRFPTIDKKDANSYCLSDMDKFDPKSIRPSILAHAGDRETSSDKNPDKLSHFQTLTEITDTDITGETIEEALIYWRSIKGIDVAPSRKSFQIDQLPPKLIPSVAVIDFVDEPMDFLYRFFGTHLVHVAGMELTGKRYFADQVVGFGAINETLVPELIARRAPMFHHFEWQSSRGVTYESKAVRLPLSDDGERITGMVTANTISLFARTYR
jgi:hypothetical protein